MNSTEYERLISQIVNKMTNDSELIKSGSINWGRDNKWKGKAGFSHQIDVSLENSTDVLLVECKCWERNHVSVEAFLTLWARVQDITKGPKAGDRNIRGALATSKQFQSGVNILSEYYSTQISLFVVTSVEDFVVKLHKHFVQIASVQSGERFGMAGITQTIPPQ